MHTQQPGPVGFDVYNDNLVVVVDDEVFRIPVATGTAVSMGVYASAATSFVRFTEGDNDLYSISEGLLYKHSADITTSITLPAGVTLSTITRWGYYLIGTDANVPYRLYYSKVSEAGPEFDVWETNGYVDVGGNSEIVSLKPMFNQLLVGKPEGWWSLTGVLRTNPAVRFLVSGNGPLDQRAVTTTTDNRVVYWGQETLPHWFNGSSVRLDNNYRIGRHDSDYPLDMVIATPTGKRIIMLGRSTSSEIDDTMLVNREKEWTIHQLPVQLAGIAPSDVRHGYSLPFGVVFGAIRNTTVGDAVTFVSIQHDLQRPAHNDDDWSAPIDTTSTTGLVTGSMATPAWYDPQGRQVMVRNVQIQFRKWPTGIADSLNEMQVRVRPLARWNAGSMNTRSHLWAEPSARADPNGTDDSVSFNFGEEGTSAGFQIEIPVMKGIAIREINVACELTTRRT